MRYPKCPDLRADDYDDRMTTTVMAGRMAR